jgi:CubicO group peptidase (beta-lactamase class C family)
MTRGAGLLVGLAAAALFPAAAAIAANPQLAPPCTAGQPLKPRLDAAVGLRLSALRQDMVDKRIAPGAVVLIEQRGEVIYSSAVGFADLESKRPMERDALFRIYSMTKPVTAVAALQLIERGKLSLDDPVERYIPEFANATVWTGEAGEPIRTTAAKRSVTIRDLLRHTAGLPYAGADNPVARLYALRGIPAAPGVAPPPKDGSAPVSTTAELARRAE